MGWTVLVHGGAGLVHRGTLSSERESAAREGLRAALAAGSAVLKDGGDALSAAEAAVRVLEADPLFNAGRGGVLAADGQVWCDASVMRGADRAAGAVAAVRGVRHPVAAARAVLDDGRFVLMVGEGAERLAVGAGVPTEPMSWFIVPERVEQLRLAQAGGITALDHELDGRGTVGAVVCDAAGRLAAATSTGGLTNKAVGRVGDSAVIGAGTWADDRVVAVSATGHGEAFLRAHVAGRIADLMELAGLSLDAACDRALAEVGEVDGAGGVIAVTPDGRWVMPSTTAGMYRGVATEDGVRTAIWTDDEPG